MAVVLALAITLALGIMLCLAVLGVAVVKVAVLEHLEHQDKVTLEQAVVAEALLTLEAAAVALVVRRVLALAVTAVTAVLPLQIQFLEHLPTMLEAVVAVAAQRLALEHLEV